MMRTEDSKPDITRTFSLPKKKRLTSNSQFKAVMANGMRSSDGLLTLYVAKNDFGYSRLGVSVGKSHGNAVARNRLKRILREAFRQNQDYIPAGFDYLLMISLQQSKKSGEKDTAKQLTFEQVKNSFLALLNSTREINNR
jgi:ribonuclease P protein component